MLHATTRTSLIEGTDRVILVMLLSDWLQFARDTDTAIFIGSWRTVYVSLFV